jgi:hypothetical protein
VLKKKYIAQAFSIFRAAVVVVIISSAPFHGQIDGYGKKRNELHLECDASQQPTEKEKKNETWPDEFQQLLHKKKYITIIVVCLF